MADVNDVDRGQQTAAIAQAFRNGHGKRHVNKKQAVKVKVAFRRDDLLEGEPSCFAADFKLPRLRRCPLDPATIDWSISSCIGGGRDGYVWKVWFGDDGPYALKVFWDAESSECDNYFALQRECQNTAILQMVESQMKLATRPILVNANPNTEDDALHNLMAFSHEYLQTDILASNPKMTQVPALPRIAKCYGWLEFGRQMTQLIPRQKRAPLVHAKGTKRFMSRNKDYVAIVYEYIEEGSNDKTAVETVDGFLWLVGFCVTGNAARNWRSGVLVDHSDIVYPRSYGWFKALYRPRTAAALLRP